MPKQGGNLDKLKTLLGGEKMPAADEFTMVQWSGNATDLIIFNMLEEFEKTGKSSVLDQRTLRVGLSYKGHRKVQNIF
jgi:hypothetical protein